MAFFKLPQNVQGQCFLLEISTNMLSPSVFSELAAMNNARGKSKTAPHTCVLLGILQLIRQSLGIEAACRVMGNCYWSKRTEETQYHAQPWE